MKTTIVHDNLSAAFKILQEIFGYSEFHPTQEQVISALLQGDDCLVLMPTGGGKSLCYQIPSIVREGTGIVVSPLIALMQDQVDGLRELGVKAAFLNSTLAQAKQREVEALLLDGSLDLLYVAPERLLGGRMLDLLDRCNIALFAIDEAHCVSQWGHDFRKEYQQLKILHQRFSNVPRVALTATADKRTRQEIISQLQLEGAPAFIDSFDRPNIRYQISDGANGLERLWKFLQESHPEDSGIVYCLSRKRVEQVATWLGEHGRIALAYHAGLSDRQRHLHQQRFLFEDSVIVVATIAFGMGIDKPDVRFVAHLNLPKSIEAYYQETGRAGRDGEPANAWMSYGLKDVIMLRQMVQSSDAPPVNIRVMQNKLEAMLGLCEMIGCRRRALLTYFGEQLENDCGNCDNCLNPPITWDATEIARKALSCVYRSGQRFGVGYLIDLLRGKESERIRRNRHDSLSTFGIGRELSVSQWSSVFRQLLAGGFVDVDFEGMGVIRLNPDCRPLLRGEKTLQLRRQSEPAPQSARARRTVDDIEISDVPLFEALRSLRLEIAKEINKPPFTVFHDSTLKTMAAVKPVNAESLAEISGVGQHKLKVYGPRFLKTIEDTVRC